MDIKDIVENSKKIYMSESSLKTLMDFERVLDELDIYAFKNWKKGELIEGPVRHRHWVECTFMWPQKLMPDPDGGKRLLEYRAKVEYIKDTLKTPVKIESYSDFRPGTKKAKLREDPVWTVKIQMPREVIEDIAEKARRCIQPEHAGYYSNGCPGGCSTRRPRCRTNSLMKASKLVTYQVELATRFILTNFLLKWAMMQTLSLLHLKCLVRIQQMT